MIKFSTRRNLIYVLILLLTYAIRKIVLILISSYFQFTNSILYTALMFIGLLFTGIIIFIYQKYSLPEDKNVYMPIFKYKKQVKVGVDSNWKIYSLLIMFGFFDFIEFKMSVLYLPKIHGFSGSLEDRLCGLIIIFCSIIYHYILKYPIFRHQFCSLIIIGICLVTIIITEILFQKDNIFMYNNESKFTLFIVLIFIEIFFLSILHSGDKYLLEFDSVKPYNILIFESLSGLVFTSIAFLEDNPIIKLKKIHDKESGGFFTLFIFLFYYYVIAFYQELQMHIDLK